MRSPADLASMKMRTRSGVVLSNTAIALLALLLALLVGVTAARGLLGASAQPSVPIPLPADNPATIAPPVEPSAAPLLPGSAAPATETGTSPLPASQTTGPAPASVQPSVPTVAPRTSIPSAAPRASLPPGPATSAAPGRDVMTVAPEDGGPGAAQPGARISPPPASK